MSNGQLGLSDDEFWGDYTRTEAEVLCRLRGEGFLGILIDVPTIVPIDRRYCAPVVGWWIRTFREDRVFDAKRDMLICGVDMETNQFRAGLALDTGKTPAEPPPTPAEDPGEGTLMEMVESDARARLDLPWRTGRHAITFVMLDKRSNTVMLKLWKSDAIGQQIDSGGCPEEQGKLLVPSAPMVWPPKTDSPLPFYGRSPESPPLPEAVGINLSTGTLAVVREGERCLLWGSFRLPVLKQERNLPLAADERLSASGYDSEATAVVRITILLTGSEAVGPFVLPLRIPAYTPFAPDKGDTTVSGYFTVDLFCMDAMPRTAMVYFAYAFSGAVVAGPVPVTLVVDGKLPLVGE